MYCVRNITSDLYWVGANDHRLALFENCFPIPRGVSYNAYCLLDEKTVLFDTVDWSACRQLLENLNHVLNRAGAGLSAHQPPGAGSRRLHRGDPAAAPQGEGHLQRKGLHAHEAVRLPRGRPRVHRGEGG